MTQLLKKYVSLLFNMSKKNFLLIMEYKLQI